MPDLGFLEVKGQMIGRTGIKNAQLQHTLNPFKMKANSDLTIDYYKDMSNNNNITSHILVCMTLDLQRSKIK